MPIQTLKPRTFPEYVEAVESLRREAGTALWFRGCSSADYTLVPSLYRQRRNSKAEPQDLSDLESRIVARFRDRSLPYSDQDLSDGLRTLFFMQHYGVPTRLLDWSENPFVGLYFSIINPRYELRSGRRIYASPAIVWVLDPTTWNRNALAHMSYNGGALDANDEQIGPYESIGYLDALPEPPLALNGAYNSQRIIAQRGAFVIFGKDRQSMAEMSQSRNSLHKIVILKSVIDGMREALLASGITEGTLFPDLEGLGMELRRTFGFTL